MVLHIRKLLTTASVLVLSIILQTGCYERSAGSQSTVGEKADPKAVRLTMTDIDAGEPDIAVDESGVLYVVYAEHQDARNADLKLLKLDSQGRKIGESIKISTGAGEAKIWAGDPPKVVVREQSVYVAWTRKFPDPAARGNELMLSVSRDSGATFEPPVRVNDDVIPASHGMHSLAVKENGDVVMLWLDERSLAGKDSPDMTADHEMAEPNAEVYYAVSKDGGRSFGENRKIASDVCPCCKTSLLVAQDGAIYAAWRQVLGGEHRHIAVARSDNGGESFNKEIIVSDDKWQINACPVSGAALVSPQAGTLDVVWYTAGDAGQAGIYFARSTDRANSFAPRVMLSNEGRTGTPSAALNGEKEIVVFPTAAGGLSLVSWKDSPVSQTLRSTIPDATLPSIVTSAGRTSIVFVRTTDSKRSVWMQQVGAP